MANTEGSQWTTRSSQINSRNFGIYREPPPLDEGKSSSSISRLKLVFITATLAVISLVVCLVVVGVSTSSEPLPVLHILRQRAELDRHLNETTNVVVEPEPLRSNNRSNASRRNRAYRNHTTPWGYISAPELPTGEYTPSGIPIFGEYYEVPTFSEPYAQLEAYRGTRQVKSMLDVMQYIKDGKNLYAPTPATRRPIRFSGKYLRAPAEQDMQESASSPSETEVQNPTVPMSSIRPTLDLVKSPDRSRLNGHAYISDPFANYKPQHPSEINQLAPSSGSDLNQGPRFSTKYTRPTLIPGGIYAPPTPDEYLEHTGQPGSHTQAIFNSFGSSEVEPVTPQILPGHRPRPLTPMTPHHHPHPGRVPGARPGTRPFSVMLDIYPVPIDSAQGTRAETVAPVSSPSNDMPLITSPSHPTYRVRRPIRPHRKNKTSGRMVVHLNLYPRKVTKVKRRPQGPQVGEQPAFPDRPNFEHRSFGKGEPPEEWYNTSQEEQDTENSKDNSLAFTESSIEQDTIMYPDVTFEADTTSPIDDPTAFDIPISADYTIENDESSTETLSKTDLGILELLNRTSVETTPKPQRNYRFNNNRYKSINVFDGVAEPLVDLRNDTNWLNISTTAFSLPATDLATTPKPLPTESLSATSVASNDTFSLTEGSIVTSVPSLNQNASEIKIRK